MRRLGWFDRFLTWIGFEIEEEEPDETAAAAEPAPARGGMRERWAPRAAAHARSERLDRADARPEARGQLVSLPGAVGQRVIIVTPRDFDDVQVVADHLKNRRPVLVNLEGVDKELAQRMINFLGGTVYALNGEMHRVSTHALFFAPGGVEVVIEGRAPTPGLGG